MNAAPRRPGDTIAARATAAGRGAITIVRLSGPASADIARALAGELPPPRYAALRDFTAADGEPIDSGLLLYFPAPHSFTGEDVVEFQLHGGTLPAQLLLQRLYELGARPAEPGEFSLRAFLNDRLDLSQAEAVADLIDSQSQAAARAAQRSLRGDFSKAVLALNELVTALRVHVEAAIDFPDEDIDFLDDDSLRARIAAVAEAFDTLERTTRQGVLLRDGVQLVLAGRPNAGKSSLLNALAGHEAAIVTEVPGTTRDLVREFIDLDGLPVHIVDTAGLRADAGRIEAEGIRRAREQLAQADHALLVLDQAAGETVDELLAELPAGLPYTIARNKIDLSGEAPGPISARADAVNVSALTGAGLDALRAHLKRKLGYEDAGSHSMTARQRHLELLRQARRHFDEGCRLLREQAAGELLADELLQVQNRLAEITGEFSSDDLLGEIFARFCIGK